VRAAAFDLAPNRRSVACVPTLTSVSTTVNRLWSRSTFAQERPRSPDRLSPVVATSNGGRHRYRAHHADRSALGRGRRPKPSKIAENPELRAVIEEKLKDWWSPQRVVLWLKRTYPDNQEMQASHETIYLSLFIQEKGALRREFNECLRTGRAYRRPKVKRAPSDKGRIIDKATISQRPAEFEDRAVPGHWEGDLLMGRRQTAIGTLVERWSRYVMLFPLPDGNTAQAVRVALAATVERLPDQLWKSLTWDQGKEMAQHVQFTVDTGVQVYFCEPRSPWQRGSNENTNGLLRQYFPKRTDMAALTQHDLDEAAYSFNTRPRQTLGRMTPSQKLADDVAMTPCNHRHHAPFRGPVFR
jgi:IS30 family transposase